MVIGLVCERQTRHPGAQCMSVVLHSISSLPLAAVAVFVFLTRLAVPANPDCQTYKDHAQALGRAESTRSRSRARAMPYQSLKDYICLLVWM